MSTSSASPSRSANGSTLPSAKKEIWDERRRADLADLWARGLTAFEISGILTTPEIPITEKAVQVQASRMKLAKRFGSDEDISPNVEHAMRRCLRCTKLFRSQGKHNRICDPCRTSSDFTDSSPIFLISSPSRSSKRTS